MRDRAVEYWRMVWDTHGPINHHESANQEVSVKKNVTNGR
jgi:hypothetical protein